jgi:hypothetical protein
VFTLRPRAAAHALSPPSTLRAPQVVHGSDGAEAALREIALWFGEGALVEWSPAMAPWIVE